MTGPGLVIRQLTEDDDLEAEVELRRQAFGPMNDADRARTLAMAADSAARGAAPRGLRRPADDRRREVPGYAAMVARPEHADGRGIGC